MSNPSVQSFFLVRHGETRLSGRYCGSSNPPLTRRGLQQGTAVAQLLARIPIDICYTSPLLRAEQTAAIISRHISSPVVKHTLLKEMDFGGWEGLRFRDIQEKWPRLADHWIQDPTATRVPQGETFVSLRRRVGRFLASLRASLSRNILIVAHGGTLSAIILELLKLPNEEFPDYIQPLGSIRKVQGRTLTWLHPSC